MEDDVYRWVDAVAPEPQRFSWRRVKRLLLAILLLNFLGALPFYLIQLVVNDAANIKQAEIERKRSEQDAAAMRQALDDGTAGEAFQRMFGREPSVKGTDRRKDTK